MTIIDYGKQYSTILILFHVILIDYFHLWCKKYIKETLARPGRLPKVESFESRDTLHPKSLRPPVFKSHSFGGYSGGVTVLSRGDSIASNVSSSRLSKQGKLVQSTGIKSCGTVSNKITLLKNILMNKI